eukprot:3906030-Pyramimonas_sp.AAC.1
MGSLKHTVSTRIHPTKLRKSPTSQTKKNTDKPSDGPERKFCMIWGVSAKAQDAILTRPRENENLSACVQTHSPAIVLAQPQHPDGQEAAIRSGRATGHS